MAAFTSEKKKEVNFITCPEAMDATAAKQLTILSTEWLSSDATLHLFDFKEVKTLANAAYKPIILFKRAVTAAQKTVCSINMSPEILQQIQDDGLDAIFTPCPSIHVAQKKAGIKMVGRVNPEFISPFVGAVQVALRVQASTPVTAKTPFVKKEPYDTGVMIAAIISLVSEDFTGSIALCFPQAVFLDIYNNMLGEKATEITKDIEDGAGELLNIIFGLAKANLNNQKGYTIQKAIPTVLTGEKLRISNSNTGTTVVLPFETKVGMFFMEVVFT